MIELLRQYTPEECDEDGYPYAWHGRSAPAPIGGTLYETDDAYIWTEAEISGGQPGSMQPLSYDGRWPAIKDLIREQAGHRCLRCGHPYPPGIADEYPRGEWTPCDDGCTHGGPVRVWAGDDPTTEEPTWDVVQNLDARAWMGYRGRSTFKMQALWRILTVHHLDSDKANCRWWNLAALCQRCHLRMQRTVVMGRVYNYEHSEWFKPFAAGFYAMKYEGLGLSREATLDRLDELLAYEHRFTQEELLD